MGEAILVPSLPIDSSSGNVKTFTYTGNGPVYSGTYSVTLRELDLGVTPKSVTVLGYGMGGNYGGFTGAVMQGASHNGPSNVPYIRLSGSKLYVCSWTYTANAGFYFYANTPDVVYVLLITV